MRTQMLRRPVDALIDALIGRAPVRVTWPDGAYVTGYATRIDETELGQWLVVTGDDGRRHRISMNARVCVEWGGV